MYASLQEWNILFLFSIKFNKSTFTSLACYSAIRKTENVERCIKNCIPQHRYKFSQMSQYCVEFVMIFIMIIDLPKSHAFSQNLIYCPWETEHVVYTNNFQVTAQRIFGNPRWLSGIHTSFIPLVVCLSVAITHVNWRSIMTSPAAYNIRWVSIVSNMYGV